MLTEHIKIYFIEMSLIILLCGCNNNDYNFNEYTAETEITSENKPTYYKYNYLEEMLYGSWVIDEVEFWNIDSAISITRPIEYEDKYIGSIIKYQGSYVKLNNKEY